MEKMDGMTMNLEQANVEKLKEVFPEVFADGKVDFDKLQMLLGNYIADDKERYSFSWKGKTDSLRLAQKRSTGTLRPCKEESKNWDTTENLYIEGDNLEVLKLLQSAYLNSVKMIYIDPPYNTGNDFVYTDAHYKEVTGQATKSNPETAGRYHTNWLNMMYPRLKLARNLLTDDGVIFISIDDNEQANLKKLCDEVFGEAVRRQKCAAGARRTQNERKARSFGKIRLARACGRDDRGRHARSLPRRLRRRCSRGVLPRTISRRVARRARGDDDRRCDFLLAGGISDRGVERRRNLHVERGVRKRYRYGRRLAGDLRQLYAVVTQPSDACRTGVRPGRTAAVCFGLSI